MNAMKKIGIIDDDSKSNEEFNTICKSPNFNMSSIKNKFIEADLEQGLHIFKEGVKNVDKPKRKRLAIVDSDSDDNKSSTLNRSAGSVTSINEDKHNSDADSDDNSSTILKSQWKTRTIVDSDSDEELHRIKSDNATTSIVESQDDSEIVTRKLQENIGKRDKPLRKIFSIVDSDSEEETVTLPKIRNFNNVTKMDEKAMPISKLDHVVDSNDYSLTVSRVSALCDEDSDDADSSYATANDDYKRFEEASITKIKKSTKKRLSKEGAMQKKMTAKQAMQQREEIRSASQKRLREMPVSLPYHKPKARSIKEFLQNRPRLSLSLMKDSAKTPPSLALKMSTQELEVVTKKLEERRVKMVKEFYLSESESEDDVSENVEKIDTLASNDDSAKLQNENVKDGSEEVSEAANTAEQMDTLINSDECDECDKLQNKNVKDAAAEEPESVNGCTEKLDTLGNNEHCDMLRNQNLGEASELPDCIGACTENNEHSIFESQINNDGLQITDVADTSNNQDTAKSTNLELSMEQAFLCGNDDNSKGDVINTPTEFVELVDTQNSKVVETKDNNVDEQLIESTLAPESAGLEILNDLYNIESNTSDVTNLNRLEQICPSFDTNLELNRSQTDNSVFLLESSIPKIIDNTEIPLQPTDSELLNKSTEECEPAHLVDDAIEIRVGDQIQSLEKDVSDNNQKSFTEEQHSEEFDFNLDDMEVVNQPPASNIQEDHLQRLLKKYSTCSSDSINQQKSLSTLELFKQQVGDFKPFLSGSPDEYIDLEHGTTKPTEVSLLVKRFMKHNTSTHKSKQKVQLDVINLTQGELRHETVAISVEPEEEPIKVIEIPGSKLRKLKQELQTRIAQQRWEQWQQKLQVDKDKSIDSTVKDVDQKSDYEPNADINDEILDDEEEAELTDENITDDEDDNVDDDENVNDNVIARSEKRGATSEFIDGEAEETDADDEYDENDDVDEPEVNERRDVNTDENQENVPIKKPLKRILKGFIEDSDEEDDSLISANNVNSKPTNSLDIDILDDDDDEPIPPNRPRVDITPLKTTQLNSEVGCLTPILHLTGLENLNSGSKFLEESPVYPTLTSLQQSTQHQGFQKKLFTDLGDASDKQLNFDGVAQFCPGSFSGAYIDTQSENIPTTQDLVNICSGSFSLTYINKKADETSLAMNTQSTVIHQEKFPSTEMKTLNEDKLISELLDEEEMEQFKKKFESPIEPHVTTTIFEQNYSEDEVQEVQGGGIIFSDCSDDENIEIKTTSTKKLKKKLAFTDDESSNSEDDHNNETEEINLHDNISDLEDTENNEVEYNSKENEENNEVEYNSEENEENNEVEYDSEENEIDSLPQATNVKLADFLENEAELSESEWDSADEDERGLDILETEQGDADVFDENEMRNDLERIHMRRVLDQDNQEIKMLQELLLEDGELHGTGRQRQFRWNNIDYGDDNQPRNKPELDVYLDDEECEEQWRRTRHEREMFFKKKQEKLSGIEEDDFISADSNSQIIKLGQEALRKSLSNSTTIPDKAKCQPTGLEITKPLTFMNTRGSFLARTDQFLTKLAEFSKVSTETVLKTTKNPKGFVFQALASENDMNEKKRKAADKTPSLIKRLRLSKETTSPSVYRKKKLF